MAPCQPLHGGLTAAIERQILEPGAAAHGANVDDAAAASGFRQVRDDGGGQEGDGADVEVENVREVGCCDVLRGPDEFAAGVVD